MCTQAPSLHLHLYQHMIGSLLTEYVIMLDGFPPTSYPFLGALA